MARIARLKRRSEFLRARSEGQKWAARGLILQAVTHEPGPDGPAAELPFVVGYTASRRVGGAVQRNRAKRRLRAAVERVMPERAVRGYDYVVIARPETLSRPFEALVGDLLVALGRLGLDREQRAGPPAAGQSKSRRRAPPSETVSEARKE
ncbi:MAG: ribonuclease P protein component [Alphaproteobacteria bacterium]